MAFIRTPIQQREANERVKDWEEVTLGLNEEDTKKEAGRCLNCKKPMCVPTCPAHIEIPKFPICS